MAATTKACAGCGVPFDVGETVVLGQDEYHSECFRCGKCNTQIVSKFALVDGMPVCPVDCSPELSKCCACNLVINTSYVTFGSKNVHERCFQCERCAVSLVGQDAYVGQKLALCTTCLAKGKSADKPCFEDTMKNSRDSFVRAVERIVVSLGEHAVDAMVTATLQAGGAVRTAVLTLRGIQGQDHLHGDAGKILAEHSAKNLEVLTSSLILAAKEAKANMLSPSSKATLLQALTTVAAEMKHVADCVEAGHYVQTQPPPSRALALPDAGGDPPPRPLTPTSVLPPAPASPTTREKRFSAEVEVEKEEAPAVLKASQEMAAPPSPAPSGEPAQAAAKVADAGGTVQPRLIASRMQNNKQVRNLSLMAINPRVPSPKKPDSIETIMPIRRPTKPQRSTGVEEDPNTPPPPVFVRVLRRLDVTVSEAKGLGGPNVQSQTVDAYCMLSVGAGQNYRTSTKFKSQEPFWGEDVSFDLDQCLPLQIVVWNDKTLLRRAAPIGHLSLSRDEVQETLGGSEIKWYKLKPASGGFVTGEVQVSVDLVAARTYRLTVHRISNLLDTVVLGSLAPYVEVSVGDFRQQTAVATGGGLDSQFNDTFEIVLTEAEKQLGAVVTLRVMNSRALLSDNFLGMTTLNLSALDLRIPNKTKYEGWLSLEPEQKEEVEAEDAGSVRLKMCYCEDVILPESEYNDLLELLLEPELHVPLLIIDVSRGMYDVVAGSLVKILHAKRQSTRFVCNAVSQEVDSAKNTAVLFRGNSLATKVVDFFMKMLGFEYLNEVLGPVLRYIFKSTGSYEVDPTKCTNPEEVTANWPRLLKVMKLLCERIYASVPMCPLPMREAFAHIQQAAITRFPDETDVVRYTSVSGFLFLRFFVPALLTPKLFRLWPVHVENEDHNRCLTLIAKGLQTLTNFVKAKGKEGFMKPMEEFFNEHVVQMKNFIDEIAHPLEQRVPYIVVDIDFEQELSFIHGHVARRMDDIKKCSKLEENPYLKLAVPRVEEVVTRISSRIDAALAAKETYRPHAKTIEGVASVATNTMVSDEVIRLHFADNKSWEILRAKDHKPLYVEGDLSRVETIVYVFYQEEVTYVNELNKLEQEYVVPLQSRRSADKDVLLPEVISDGECRAIFTKLATVLNLQRALLKQVEDFVLVGKEQTRTINVAPLSRILASMMPFFKIYVEYCANVGNARDILESIRKSNKKLDAFLLQMWRRNRKDVMEYIVAPVLRFSSYKQLIENLLKEDTTGFGGEYEENLRGALAEITAIDEQINTAVRGGSSARVLDAKGLKQFIAPSRKLVYEAPLSVMYPDRRAVGILFNDLLVVGRYETPGKRVRGAGEKGRAGSLVGEAKQAKFVEAATLPLASLWLEDLGDLDPRDTNGGAFEAYNAESSFFLYAVDVVGKRDWINRITEAISAHNKLEVAKLYTEPRTLQFLYQRKGDLFGCIYHGDLHLGRRHGVGTMYWANGDIYRGSWENNLPQGQGVFTCRDLPELSFDGQWDEGRPVGDMAPAKLGSLISD